MNVTLVRSSVRRRQVGVCNVDVHIVGPNSVLIHVVNSQSHHNYITSARHSRRRECRLRRIDRIGNDRNGRITAHLTPGVCKRIAIGIGAI